MVDFEPSDDIPYKRIDLAICGDLDICINQRIRQYVSDYVECHSKIISIDQAAKTIYLDKKSKVDIEFILSANDQFRYDLYGYTRLTEFAIIYFDVSKRESLDSTLMWKELFELARVKHVDSHIHDEYKPISFILVGVTGSGSAPILSNEEFCKYALENGFLDYFQIDMNPQTFESIVMFILNKVMGDDPKFLKFVKKKKCCVQ